MGLWSCVSGLSGGDIPWSIVVYSHYFGVQPDNLKFLRYNAADDVRDVFLYNDFYADERTVDSCGFNASVGATLYADIATALFCRDSAVGISQGHHNCRTMGEFCCAWHFCSSLQHSCRHYLQETGIEKEQNQKVTYKKRALVLTEARFL